MDVQKIKTKALELSVAIYQYEKTLGKEGCRGERVCLETTNTALTELLERYESGEWKPPNGNNIVKSEGEEI